MPPRSPLPEEVRFYALEEAAGLAGEQPSVIIGVHNFQADLPGIIRQLRDVGLRRIVTPVELYDEFGGALGDRYWLTSRKFYVNKGPLLEQVEQLWCDDVSRELFQSILRFRLTGDPDVLPAPDTVHQYFPPDLPAWQKPLRLIDCGAFDGDTIHALLGAGYEIEAVAAFEPDTANFKKLAALVKQSKLQEAYLWPCGVYSAATQLAFEDGNGTASGIAASGRSVIQGVSLDEAVPTFRPNLIKIDIEGAEYDALQGARRLIQSDCPGLAVALYHRPDDLWRVPLLIREYAPSAYRYFLRSHARNDFELMLYAVPQEG